MQRKSARISRTSRTVRIYCASLAIFAVAAAFLIASNAPATAACGGTLPPCTGATSLFFQNLGNNGRQVSQVSLTGVEQQIWSIEDRLQCMIGSDGRSYCERRSAPTRWSNAFTEEAPAPEDPTIDSAFAALGYSANGDQKSPIVVKSPPPAPQPAQNPVSFSAWGQGSVDYQNRSGTFAGVSIGSNTMTATGVFGADATLLNPTSASDALVFGLFTADTTAQVHNADASVARINGPSVGAYGAYVNGAFSMDGTFKTDFLNVGDVTLGGEFPFGLDNYAAVGNVKLKQDFGSWWFEPTAGFTYTRTMWDGASRAFGMNDGYDWRVQGGARIGSGFEWGGIHFDEKLTLLAYDDVTIAGGTLAVVTGTPLTPSEEGKIFGQAIGTIEAQLTRNWLVSVEGEYRGSTDIYGLAGRVVATYSFN